MLQQADGPHLRPREATPLRVHQEKPPPVPVTLRDWLAQTPFESKVRFCATYGFLAILLLASVVVLLLASATLLGSELWLPTMREHFAAVIGLPATAALILFVVLGLHQTMGRMEIELPGVKLRGAAAGVVLWTIGVVAIGLVLGRIW